MAADTCKTASSCSSPFYLLSASPFLLTFAVVLILAWKTLFPLLSGESEVPDTQQILARRVSWRPTKLPATARAICGFLLDRAAVLTFSTTIALSAVLAELIFCEISNILNPVGRSIALQVTISVLLFSLVVATPALEIHSITTAAGWRFSGLKRGPKLVAWVLDVVGLVAWLVAFWWFGKAILGKHTVGGHEMRHAFSEGSLERIGIIGISLMGSLAGFAAVSSLWQTFGVRVRKISETDIARKQAGLDATTDLLASKRSRLRALESKMTLSPKESFMSRMLSSVRGSKEHEELSSLRLEISGLETMSLALSNSARVLRSQREAQRQASTPVGRVCITASYAFSLYCLYRIAATSIATFRRWWHPTTSFASTDPINNVLALVAKHIDPTLDREAWSRQISFLLSGLMLLASFNAVLQTVLLFSRFTPARLLHSARQNLALLVSQISATYVVSSALLLRSNLPKEMGSVISGALGAPLDAAFVERWFEGWFLAACGVTAAGIWVGRKVVGVAEWEEDCGEGKEDVEMGKRS
ncbi:MAG: hypothetical protein M1828_006116 [Chrysothrix sp. TS-e1954]|nr:MAG: hypothetical protein M1828_006116 [Chrysothrix sp. TS-e1954]